LGLAASGAESVAPSARQSSVPPSVPDHELLRSIGVGSYGEVWLARSALGSLRAVKVVYRKSFDHDRPYEREFGGLKQFEPLSHARESQVDIFHVGRNEAAGFFYYIMELADPAVPLSSDQSLINSDQSSVISNRSARLNTDHSSLMTDYSPRTLKHDLRTRGALPITERVQIALSLTRALEHLHSHGLVHRDIKPSNIIFVKGVPKLADIGLVTSVDATRSFVGTDGYIPPEGPGTAQGDLYSLGKVLYECATGKDRLEHAPRLQSTALSRTARRVAEFNEILTKACDADPRQRFQTAAAMRAEIDLLQAGESIKRKRTCGRRWKLAKNTCLVASVVILISASAVFAVRELNRNRPLSSNPEALKLYQQAVYMLNRFTLDGHLQAYTNLTEAVRLDPQFVDAYYMLFEVYFADGQLPPHNDTMANFRWVVDSLRALAPDSAQYHTANAWIKYKEWRFEEEIAELKLALRANPKFLRAHGFYGGIMLRARGDAETALREFRAAEQIDPRDSIIQMHLGTPYYFRREFVKAIEQYQKALVLEPRTSGPHGWIARAYEADQQYDKALAEYEADEKLTPGANPAGIETRYKRWRSALSEKGPRGMFQVMLDEWRRDWPDPYALARLWARLGNTNEVFVLLEKAYREHHGNMPELLLDDCWDPLRDDPRFKELLDRMGFSKVSPSRK